VVGERLYFGTSNGTLHSVNRVNGQGEWSLELGSPLTAPITFASGILYARTEDGTLHKIR
jgi:outer membrane protein assembly factor BamB